MKKILSIFAVSMMLINPLNAAENIYLICKIKVTENRSQGFFEEYFAKGEIVNALYIRLKKTKSYAKAQFSQHQAGIDWKETKPEAMYELKASIENEIYKFKDKFKSKEMDASISYNISNNGGIWSVDGYDKFLADSDSGKIDINYDFLGKCDLYNKKDFLKYRKKGIS